MKSNTLRRRGPLVKSMYFKIFFVAVALLVLAAMAILQSGGRVVKADVAPNDEPSATLPPGFFETTISGLSSPTAIALHPDGRIFACEQGGALRVIKNGVLLATPFVTVPTSANGERGLLGVTFDPGYALNHYIYVYYTAATPATHNRVSRFTADFSNPDVAVPGSELAIVDLDNLSSATNHNGGAIHFGPDGKLYIAVGENANSANAQSIGNRLGKMLRVNSDGSIPSDNPTSFPNITGTPTGLNRMIWTVGLRNPYTFAFQAGTGRMFINDVGQNTWEEINDGIAGSNYGWPVCEGQCGAGGMTNPVYQYSSSTANECAITGGDFYNPTTVTFPGQYVGKYFFADYCGGWIKTIDPLNPPPTGNATDFASGISAPVDIHVANDGTLYYLARDAGAVVRVQYLCACPTPTPPPPPTPTVTPTPPATPSPTPTPTPPSTPPRYRIYDIGVVQPGDSASQGFGVSPNGIAVGRSFRSNGAQAFSWTRGAGLVGLPNLAGRAYAVANSANNGGLVVGTAATTSFGSGRLPVQWQGGVVSQLPLPGGQTLGDAYSVNSSGVAVGSVDAGTTQRGVIYNGANATIITQTTSTGCFFVTAFGINDAGRIAGYGWDPTNAARNVGMVYDMSTNTSFEVGALPGANGAINFGTSNSGYIVGSSMMNQGSGLPFIWSPVTGMRAIPLAAGTSQGSARAVNSAGWAVGQDSSAFSIPFLYDGNATYRLADLIPAGTGWDLSTNTSSSALGISDGNMIVGTGVYNGETHAYAMVPALATPFDYDNDGKADVSVFRPSTGTWYLQQSTAGFAAASWGVASDKITPADYDGDGRTDVAVYRPSEGNWYVLRSSTGTIFATHFGVSEDLPVPADFDSDGKADVAVYRPSTGTWWIQRTTAGLISAQFGTSEDKPVVGDYDGDGQADLGVFRPSTGTWYHSNVLVDPSHNFVSAAFGLSTDLVTPADLDGDGKTDIAVYRPSNGTWYWLSSANGSAFNAVQFGIAEDIPTAADFDGDGKADISVFRPSSGVWYRLNSSNGGFAAVQFGVTGDRPTPAAFR